MKTDTGTEQDTSIGKKSTETRTLAGESGKAEKPLQAAQTTSANVNTLQALAELLSLIQEDCRRYSETLAPFLPERLPVFMKFNRDGIIFIAAPPGHRLDTGNGHILLDGQPVTGWDAIQENETLAKEK